MNLGNFIKEHQVEIILIFITAISAAIIEIILKPFRALFKLVQQNITKIFTEKKFEQKYRDWLIEKYRFLQVRGIKTDAPVAIELEKVFILLRMKGSKLELAIDEFMPKVENMEFVDIKSKEIGTKEGMIKLNKEQEIIERAIDELQFIRKIQKEDDILKRTEMMNLLSRKTYDLNELLSLPKKRSIIIGTPGSGKTTLLSYLAFKFASKSSKKFFGIENEILPIFISLRDTAKEGFSLKVKEFTENYINYIDCPHRPPLDFFKKKLDEGKCIILLDGLDEVATVEQRVNVAKWVDELATAYSKNIFITTSRPYGYETAHLYNDFLELNILDFTTQQVEQFIRYWTKAVEIKVRGDESEFTLGEAKKRAEDLLKAIKDNSKIEVLTVNPLLLTIVALVHRYRAALPERRVELYEECCDVLLGYWDTVKGLAGELQPRQKRAILQPLAYYLHLNGLREEKREKFIELLENELPKIAVSKEKANDFLNNVKERCGVLVETKIDYFGFTHLTFQEFLTARYILDNNLEDFLVTKKRDKYWLEVTLLYCGMKDATSLLQKILKEKEDLFYTNLFLAGRCLAESLSVSPELRAEVTDKMLEIYQSKNEFERSREIALEILREIKNPRMIQQLIEKSNDKETNVRLLSVETLGEVQATEAVQPLIELLKDKNSEVRGSAAAALGEIRAEEAVRPLIELLKDKDGEVKRSAAYALGEIQAEEAIQPVIELLKDKENLVALSAAFSINRIQAVGAVEQLIELLKDKESHVREFAAFSLGIIQAKEAIAPLIELLKDKDSRVRLRAADALGDIHANEAVKPLTELLKDKEDSVRWTASFALGEVSTKEEVKPLTELLKDKNSNVRSCAAFALSRIKPKEAVEPLIELLHDKDSEVREAASAALGEIQAVEAVQPLIELLKDKNSEVRGSAAGALGGIQAEEAVQPLIKLLKDKDSDVRGHAAFALGEIQAKEAIAFLIELLRDKKSHVRERAAYALGEIQAKEAVAPLIELLKDKDSDVRGRAAFALGEIGDKKAVGTLRTLLNDREYVNTLEQEVRECAFNALKEISEKTGTPIYKD